MGKKDKKKSKKSSINKIKKPSGGRRHQAKARQQKLRLEMKIRRWIRYRSEKATMKLGSHRGGGAEPWDIRGMEAHIKRLDKIIASPIKRP